LSPCLVEKRMTHSRGEHAEQRRCEDRMPAAGDGRDSRSAREQRQAADGADPRAAPFLHIN